MKFFTSVVCLAGITSTVQAAAIPDTNSLSLRTTLSDIIPIPSFPSLEKRKGGGGGGGGKGGGGGGSSSSSSSSSGSSSGSSGSSSGAGTGAGSRGSGTGGSSLGSSSSSTGGRTSTGSGVSPSYGGGRYYGGGATTPYASGARSPLGISPLYFAAPALAFGGLYAYGAYGAYGYPYAHPYSFHNASGTNTNGTNTTLPVQCVCGQYAECGCDDNQDQSYLDSVVGNGTNLNSSLARVADVNGTRTLLINGTLPNGTTASGGTESASGTSAAMKTIGEMSGYWMMLTVVAAIVLSN